MNPALKLLPWQLWVVDFGAPTGHRQAGVRPAIVVGSARHCEFRTGMALVVPLTTRDRSLRHHVRIASVSSGVRLPSWARTEEITSVSTLRFGQSPIGLASSEEIAELRMWLREMVAF